jgi:tRNA-specific 2-thiouridylase
MSGGVDSSVAAALLKKQGYEVIGMMLRLWSEPGREDSNRCCTPDSMAMARRVAARLDIPFFVVDAKEIFRSTVVQFLLDGYAQGLTPNPCLVCNRMIRWEFLLNHALALGADFMATGHYVRMRTTAGERWQLLRAIDPNKDQSYVLYFLTQEKLKKTLFPVGDYPKSRIRSLASDFGLPVATRADSQDLCFLSGGDYRQFLKRFAPRIAQSGQVVNRQGKVLASHQGLPFYTVGQRKGLGIAAPQPLYVLAKDITSNTLIVGTEDERGQSELKVGQVNWLGCEPPLTPIRAKVKIRYTSQPAWAEISPVGEFVTIRFENAQRDITPGQAAVFYDDDVLLGGGIIV